MSNNTKNKKPSRSAKDYPDVIVIDKMVVRNIHEKLVNSGAIADTEIVDPDLLVRGMVAIANRKVSDEDTMLTVFLEQLLIGAVAAGSKGVQHPDK